MATPIANSVPLLTTSNNNNGTLTDEFISGLIQGGSWRGTGGVITYSFSIDEGVVPPNSPLAWTTGLVDAFKQALAAWSDVANITFVDMTGAEGAGWLEYPDVAADIAVTLTGDQLFNLFGAVGLSVFPDPVFADAFFREADYPRPEGDIFLDNFLLEGAGPGSQFNFVALHEIGHSLGLKHTTDDGGNGRPRFEDLGISQFDTLDYTVMSGAGISGSAPYPTMPMLLDILVIQHIYGANLSFNTGNDTYSIGNGLRAIWDAGGIDTLSAAGQPFGTQVTIDLRSGMFSGSTDNLDTAIAYNVVIENAIGGFSNDTIFGNNANNDIEAGQGADHLDAGSGDDTVSGGDGTDTLIGGLGNDSLLGGADPDTITGGDGNDSIDGGFGPDSMIGGSGDDQYVVDSAESSTTYLTVDNFGGSQLVFREHEGTFTISASDSDTDSDTLVDTVTGFFLGSTPGQFANFSFSSRKLNAPLTAGTYTDVERYPFETTGHAGLSIEANGVGTNTVSGSFTVLSAIFDYSGDQPEISELVVDYSQIADGGSLWTGRMSINGPALLGPHDNIIELSGQGTDTVFSSVSYVLDENLENLTLTGATDSNGTGNSGNNVLFGNSGFNVLTGGGGDDTYSVDAGDTVVENTAEGTDTVLSGLTYSLLGTHIENLTLLGDADIDGTGNDAANIILGNSGINTLTGGLGDDSYGVDNVEDVVIESAGEGTDTVRSSITYNLSGIHLENLTLTGSAAIDGRGNDDNNIILGNGGINTLTGGLGDDTYGVDNTGDVVIENGGEGTDTVLSSLGFYTIGSGSNLENLMLAGTQGIGGAGNELANVLTGNSSGNHLFGAFGDDAIDGGEGGLDTAVYAASRASYAHTSVVPGGGYVAVSGAEGNDTLTSIERLQFSDGTWYANTGLLHGKTFGDRGKGDLLWRSVNGDISIWMLDGLTLSQAALTSLPKVPTTWNINGTGDFDGNGKSDILWRGPNGEISVWQMDGFNVAGANYTSINSAPLTWKISATGDFNGDGRSDILWRGPHGEISVWQMDGFNVASANYASINSAPLTWKISATGDFNGDGKSDILWRGPHGEISLWQMDGFNVASANYTSINSAPLAWEISTTGEFDGDGKTDILWRGPNGEVSIWLMDGLNVKAAGYTWLASVPTDWKIADIGEFNGDGRSDIVWRRNNGQVAVWLMDGFAAVGAGSTSHSFIPNAWQIAAGNPIPFSNAPTATPPTAIANALEGTPGTDVLTDPSGGNYFNGGANNDALNAGAGSDFLIGGVGSDTISAGMGKDIIALNVGDGNDIVTPDTGTDNTLSLGAEAATTFDYADFEFSKSGNDLVFNINASDSLTLKDWYVSPANRNVLNLQVIAEAMEAFTADNADPLLDTKVELFDFRLLADRFDLARSADPTMNQWALTNALLDAHLGGSDTEAIGGDFAYLYGTTGTLVGSSVSDVNTLLASSSFGSSAQPFNTFSNTTNPKLTV